MAADDLSLPENVRRLSHDEKFRFSCQPEVSCFTDCCRHLELALSPYDVLRLRGALGMSSGDFLERYVLVGEVGEGAFPQVFLAMNDDGCCPFVCENGCSVYGDRPGACRTYPLGRGSFIDEKGQPAEIFVLLTESHCHGFADGPEISTKDWFVDQKLSDHNGSNDLLMTLLQHDKIREGFRPSRNQQERYLNVLYNLDDFRRESFANNNIGDQELLKLAIRLIHDELFC